jgi:hypothetical protein
MFKLYLPAFYGICHPVGLPCLVSYPPLVVHLKHGVDNLWGDPIDTLLDIVVLRDKQLQEG